MPRGGSIIYDDKIVSYVDFSKLIDKRIKELFDIKGEITSAISKLKNRRFRTILIKRYINFETFEQISVEMNYSYVHICRLHGEALEKMKDVI